MSTNEIDIGGRRGPQNDEEVTETLMGLFAPPPAPKQEEELEKSIAGADANDASKETPKKSNDDATKDDFATKKKAEANNTSFQILDDEPAPWRPGSRSNINNNDVKNDNNVSSAAKNSSSSMEYSSSSVMGGALFEPPSSSTLPQMSENTPLLASSSTMFGNDTTTPKIMSGNRKRVNNNNNNDGSSNNKNNNKTNSTTATTATTTRPSLLETAVTPSRQSLIYPQQSLPSIQESGDKRHANTNTARSSSRSKTVDIWKTCKNTASMIWSEITKPSTWIGSFMFLLYHNVFCLTMGSAINGSYRSVSMLGLFTKMAALGVMVGSPVYWINFKGSSEIPALYPTVDLFTAPFLAAIAVLVDEALHDDPNIDDDDDDYFLASFAFLASLAALMSGTLIVLTGVFKLANLGSYLPFPVLAGFFAAVGVLTWTLAFKIDTHMPIGQVVFSGDWQIIKHAILHHAPSFVIAGLMKYLGRVHPFYVIGLVLSSIVLFYMTLLVTGISLETATEEKWLWSQSDLVYEKLNANIGFLAWAPPAPFGMVNSLFQGKVHWGAVAKGLEPTLALSFLYLIRCSIHGAALKKNVATLKRTETIPVEEEEQSSYSRLSTLFRGSSARNVHQRHFSEAIDLEHVGLNNSGDQEPTKTGTPEAETTRVVSPKQPSLSTKEVLLEYGHCSLVCAFIGSFCVVPSVAASPVMYLLRAETIAPQVGACFLLFLFYMTDFQIIGYIPKTAFSALLVLAFLDMMDNWFIKSYFRTKQKTEWLVVPLIVVFAFVVGLLNAVFLGIAMSTFIFVAAFFRSGVVKYIANGISVRSTIERPPNAAEWLDTNGELIQVLVLQNYLFFGNASSILAYISSMFEEPDPLIDPIFVPPIPKIVILDLTLVTGMDTSSVDVFKDILNLTSSRDCKLFLAGLSRGLIQTMALSGLKADKANKRSARKLRFFLDLDAAVGKSEDMLLQQEGFEDQLSHPAFLGNRGFEQCLVHIDKQHSVSFAKDLKGLSKYTTKVTLEPGQILYEDVQADHGLFFIEHGILKVERDVDATLTRKGNGDTLSRNATNHWASLNHVNARGSEMAEQIAKAKANSQAWHQPKFRVARIGPGWVIGAGEILSQTILEGVRIAVSKCELHHISFDTIKEIEKTDPVLILNLYKLLSCLMAKRQSVTINQLATLHSIMSSPAQKLPTGRSSVSLLLSQNGD